MPHPDEGTIHAWLDGALPAGEAAQLEAHVAGCAACAAAVAEARGLIAASSRILSALDAVPAGVVPGSAAAPEPAPAAAAAATEPVRDGGITPIRAPLRGTRWRVGPLRAAAAVLLMAGGAAVVFRSTDRGEVMSAADSAAPLTVDAAEPALQMSVPESGPTVTAGDAREGDGATPTAPPAVSTGRGGSATGPIDVQLAPQAIPQASRSVGRAKTAAPREESAERERSANVASQRSGIGAGTGIADSGASLAASAVPLTVSPSAAPLADRDAAARRTVERRAAESAERMMSAPASAAPPAAPSAARDMSAASIAQAPAPDDEAAPMIRQVSGWTVLGSAVVRDSVSLVRRTTYRVPSGLQLTLEEAVPRDTISISARSRARQDVQVIGGASVGQAAGQETRPELPGAVTARSAPGRAAPAAAAAARVNVLRWPGEEGTSLSLSGATDVRTLEALREEIRRAAATRRP